MEKNYKTKGIRLIRSNKEILNTKMMMMDGNRSEEGSKSDKKQTIIDDVI